MGKEIDNNIINEGGAGGAMQHPFAVPGINSGKDLLRFFETAAKFVMKNPEKVIPSDSSSIKFDGINTSIKLVDGPGGKEFALDRGSVMGKNGQLDIQGLTIDRLSSRFPEGHGMIAAGKVILGIFNRALPKIKKELQLLGMWEDSSIFLNSDFVWSKTNVVKYPEDFIAIHGVNQFYEKQHKNNYRPGLIRPSDRDTGKPTKSKATEISYDPNVLESIKSKLAKAAKDYNFNIYTVVATAPKQGLRKISFENVLSQPVTIKFQEKEITNTLGQWLNNSSVQNPKTQMVTLSDGRKVGALSKLIFQTIMGGAPLSELLMDASDSQLAVNGAIFYHATQELGKEILASLTSPVGDLAGTDVEHEGIVLRNKKLFGEKPVKITGDFITRGDQSPFRKKQGEQKLEEESIEDDVDMETDNPNIRRKIAIYPGKFKPPQRGHLDAVKFMIDAKKVDHLIIFISPIPKKVGDKEIGVIESKKIWELYLDATGYGGKVTVMQSPLNSPVQTNYDVLTGDVPVFIPKAGDLIIPVASDKPDPKSRKPDYFRFAKFHEWVPKPPRQIVPGVMTANIMNWYVECTTDECGSIDASDFRSSLEDGSDISRYLPEEVEEADVRNILGFPSEETYQEKSIMNESLYEVLNELVHEQLVLEGDWQPISKRRTSKGHKKLLDTGRKDLTKYGKPFDQPRLVDKSNAFLAKESIEINEGLKEKLLAGLIMLSSTVAMADPSVAPPPDQLIKSAVQALSAEEVNDIYKQAVNAVKVLEKSNLQNKKPLASTFSNLMKNYDVKFKGKGIQVSKKFEIPEVSSMSGGSVEGAPGGFLGLDAEEENEKHRRDTKLRSI